MQTFSGKQFSFSDDTEPHLYGGEFCIKKSFGLNFLHNICKQITSNQIKVFAFENLEIIYYTVSCLLF